MPSARPAPPGGCLGQHKAGTQPAKPRRNTEQRGIAHRAGLSALLQRV